MGSRHGAGKRTAWATGTSTLWGADEEEMRPRKLRGVIQGDPERLKEHRYLYTHVYVSHSVVSDSLQPHRLQPARLLCL